MAAHDGRMVMASWPAKPGRPPRQTPSVRVRRLAQAAMRRALRQSVLLSVSVLAALVLVDDSLALLREAQVARSGVAVDSVALAVDVGMLLLMRRGRLRPEVAALVALLLTVISSLLAMRLDPGAVPLSSAYIATVLVASGLFLPWSPAWHWSWLAAGLGLAGVGGVLIPPFGGDLGAQLTALSVAALASGVGQPILYLRMRRMTEHQFQLRQLSRYVQGQDARVRELNVELTRTARTDSLTGLGNRRALDEALIVLAGRRLAAVLLDLDHFKAFNDRNGHLAGDVALQRVGRIMRETVRGDDLVFRYGGEEFLILVPDGELGPSAALAERVRQAIGQASGPGAGDLTISAGVAVADRFSATNPLPLLRRADAALYQAKRRGRDRVVVDGETPARAEAAAGTPA
jgi:diguanylate cyclase (GGDEF)-like protein